MLSKVYQKPFWRFIRLMNLMLELTLPLRNLSGEQQPIKACTHDASCCKSALRAEKTRQRGELQGETDKMYESNQPRNLTRQWEESLGREHLILWFMIGGLSTQAKAKKHLQREASRLLGPEGMVVICLGAGGCCEPPLERPFRRKPSGSEPCGVSLDTEGPRDVVPPPLSSQSAPTLPPHTLPPMLHPTLPPAPLTSGPGSAAAVLPRRPHGGRAKAAGSPTSPLPSCSSNCRAMTLTDRAAMSPNGDNAPQPQPNRIVAPSLWQLGQILDVLIYTCKP